MATAATLDLKKPDPDQLEPDYKLLVENVNDVVFALNGDGCFTYSNPAVERTSGYAPSEVLGRHYERFVHREDLPKLRASFERTLAGELERTEVRIVTKAGQIRHVVTSSRPFVACGRVAGVTGIMTDVTERHEAEERRLKLAQAEEGLRLRDEFLSIVSHELRTPLTVTVLQLERVLRGARRADLATPVLEGLKAARASVARLEGLIYQLLDLSLASLGRLGLNRQHTDARALVRNVVGDFEEALKRSGCDVVLNLPPEPVYGHLDPQRFEQILTNLLSNAVKFGEKHPVEITLSTREPHMLVSSVRDHGIGIAPENQSRIFERFERLVPVEHYGGLGIGLWLTRQMVEGHRGEIHVSSQVGAGSEFVVTIPCDLGTAAPAPARTTTPHP